ncbi:ATP-binding protein [Streptomyces sp. NPDC046939]|uniref:ATP-binding protein n=1 Tax=Streptomyces sp. NPDC046939 TaxID=3155376 RepID=UPI0033F51A6C
MYRRPRDEPKDAGKAMAQRTMLFDRRKLTARTAREFATETLTQWGCGERLDDIRLCTSELVTNALLHGAPTDDAILVRVGLHDGQVYVEVHDSGDGMPEQRAAQATSVNGRGLLLVSAIADDWGVATSEVPGKRVWASFKVPTRSPC